MTNGPHESIHKTSCVLAKHTSLRKFVFFRFPRRSKYHIKQRQHSAKVLISMLWFKRVMDSVILRVIENQRKSTERETDICVNECFGYKVESGNGYSHPWRDLENDRQYRQNGCMDRVFKPKVASACNYAKRLGTMMERVHRP